MRVKIFFKCLKSKVCIDIAGTPSTPENLELSKATEKSLRPHYCRVSSSVDTKDAIVAAYISCDRCPFDSARVFPVPHHMRKGGFLLNACQEQKTSFVAS